MNQNLTPEQQVRWDAEMQQRKREREATKLVELNGRRIVFVTRQRCPYCNSPELKCYKTEKSVDAEVVTRYAACSTCGQKSFVVAQ